MGGTKLGLSVLEKISNLKSSSNGIHSHRFDGVTCIQKETCLLVCISQKLLSIYSSHGQLKTYWKQGARGKILHYPLHFTP